MRDHRKLRAFRLAHELVLKVYRYTCEFPRSEQFGLTSQMRRAAVSCAANIVEGAGRRGKRDFDRFLDISFASVRELGYYIHLAEELGYIDKEVLHPLNDAQGSTAAAIAALLKQRRSA